MLLSDSKQKTYAQKARKNGQKSDKNQSKINQKSTNQKILQSFNNMTLQHATKLLKAVFGDL